MLQKIGNRTKTVLGFLLFIPIIGSFLIWGIGDMLNATGVVRYAATVGNATISTQEFARAVGRQADALKRQGVKVTTETIRNLGVAKQVLRGEIERELLLQAAHDNGIVIGDAAVAEEIKKQPAFADKKGKFSRDEFKSVLANAGMSEQEFVSGMRSDMAIKTMVGAIQMSAIPPRDLPIALYNLQKVQYTADIYTLPHAALSNSRAPTDKELTAYYESHKDRYQQPEMRRGVMATLSVTDFQNTLTPSDSDIKALYDAKKVEFSIPEERSVQFIAVPDEAKAHQIAERARGGEKLADAASSIMSSDIKLKTMNDIRAGNLPGNLDTAIFKLPRGETSEPVNTPLGWYVMQITNIKAGVIPPMDRVRDRIITAWRQAQAADALPKMLNKLDDAIGGGDNLENLAKTYHLKLRQLPFVDAGGKGQDADIAGDVTLKPAIAALFKQKPGEVGNVFELPGGDYAFLRLDEVRPARIPPLAEIKDLVSNDWKKSNQNQLAEELARKLAGDWRKSDSIADIAEKIGAKLTKQSDITRDSVQKQPSAIGRAILKAGTVGDVVTTTDGNNEYIAKVRAITSPIKANITDAALASARAEAAQSVQNDYVQIYLNALEKRYPVEVNEKAVKQIEGNAN